MQNIIEADKEIANIFFLQMIQKIIVFQSVRSFARTIGICPKNPEDYAITNLEKIKETLKKSSASYQHGFDMSCKNCSSIVMIIDKTIQHRNYLAKITDASKKSQLKHR